MPSERAVREARSLAGCDEKHVAEAVDAAEKRGLERAAKVADGDHTVCGVGHCCPCDVFIAKDILALKVGE